MGSPTLPPGVRVPQYFEKGVDLVRDTTHGAVTPESPATPPVLLKRIGSTTYKVGIHFSATSKETMQDKILRLMRNELPLRSPREVPQELCGERRSNEMSALPRPRGSEGYGVCDDEAVGE